MSVKAPHEIAGKITAAHNSHSCWACQRPVDGGVFTFGVTGSDARWYPDAQEAARANANRARYIIPVADEDIDIDEAIRLLEQQRDDLANMLEHLETQRYERRLAREEKPLHHGFITKPIPCYSCGDPKRRPADKCDRCGDEPVPLGTDPMAFNRERGYRD